MDRETQHTEDESAPNRPADSVRRKRRNGLTTHFVGFALFLFLTAVGVTFADSYLRSRPLDLRRHTAFLAQRVQDVLLVNQIPSSNIHVGDFTSRADDEALWSHIEFDVDLPKSFSPDGIERVIRRNLSENRVLLAQTDTEQPGERELRLELAGREFARVRLQGKAPPRTTDLTASTREVADSVARALQQGFSPITTFARTAPEMRNDGKARWLYTEMHADVPPDQTPEALLARVRKAAPRLAFEANLHTGTAPDERRIAVAYAGKRCVEIVLTPGEKPDVTRINPLPVRAEPEPKPIVEARVRDMRPDVPDIGDLPLDSAGLDGPMKPFAPREATQGTPRVAILVDDGGWGGAYTEQLLGLDPKLTLAIIPGTPLGTEVAERAAKLGFEIMIHMPMESFNGRINVAHKGLPEFVTTDLADAQIVAAFARAVADIPHAKGVNNHVGGKFTSNERVMRVFLSEVKRHGLYFVDSRVSSKARAYEVAQSLDMRCAENILFLDNKADADYIRKQFRTLIAIAKRRGELVAICHFRPRTVPVLAEMIPEIKKAGIELVHMSELIP